MNSKDVIIHDNEWTWGRSIVVVIENGKALCKLTWFDGDEEAYISNLIVHPSIRRKGIGTRLLGLAEEVIKEKFEVDTAKLTSRSNHWTLDWYMKHGYKTVYYDRDGDAVMQKKI